MGRIGVVVNTEISLSVRFTGHFVVIRVFQKHRFVALWTKVKVIRGKVI